MREHSSRKATAKMPVCHFPSGVIQVVPKDNNLISTNANGFGGLEGIVRNYSVMNGGGQAFCAISILLYIMRRNHFLAHVYCDSNKM